MSRLKKLIDNLKNLDTLSSLFYSLIAIIIALILGAIFIVVFGYDVKVAFYHLYNGSFGSLYSFSQTLIQTTPLIFAGLAVAIGFKSGLFNIGVEGQLYFGALASAVIGLKLGFLPIAIALPLTLLAGAIAGGVWGFIPGLLKAKTGAHEVITTIMLNEIAILATTFLTVNYFKVDGPVDQTARLPQATRLPPIIPGGQISSGILIAIVILGLTYFLLNKTSLGYDFQTVGHNQKAAEYGGINSNKMIMLAMVISGGVAGLAGSTIVMGNLGRFVTNFSPGYGFTGIAVAVLARNNPIAVLLAALLFGALEAGGMSMQLFASIPNDLIGVIQGLVILFVAAPGFIKLLARITGRKTGDIS
ncbi:MAG: ABC transporter permease [Bacillota bacterium]